MLVEANSGRHEASSSLPQMTSDWTVGAAQGLFLLDGLIWLGLAVSTALWASTSGSSLYWILAILMLGNSAVLAVLGLTLRRTRPLIYFLGLAILVVNIVLTLTDQFGLLDLLTLLLDMVLLTLLLATRSLYVRGASLTR